MTLKGRSGQGGRLYGSITTMAIAQALSEAVGHDIDRRIISLTEPIRDLGTFQVPVRLHMDLVPMVTVVVEDAAGRYFAATAEDEADAEAADADASVEDEDADEEVMAELEAEASGDAEPVEEAEASEEDKAE